MISNKFIIFLHLLMISLMLLSSCRYKSDKINKIKLEDVESIRFIYIETGSEPMVPISVRNIETQPNLDTLVSDVKTIRQYIDMINTLKISENNNMRDIRIVSYVNKRNGDQDTIAVGENYEVEYNGIGMEDSRQLFTFLYKILYTKEAWLEFFNKNLEDIGKSRIIGTQEGKNQFEEFYSRVKEYEEDRQ